MQVKELKTSGLSHEMEITVTAGDIDKRIDSRLKEVGKTVRMAGFRPGKVPLDILKKRYGKAVMGEVLEQAVNETSSKALEDKGLRPALQPKIEVKSFDQGKDLTYTMAVEVLPKFEIADFKGVKLEKPVAKPAKKEVDEALQRLAENRRTSQEVTQKRASKEGDTVVINFAGRTADDNKEHPGMKAEGHHLELGSGAFIPGFEDQLTGKKTGDKTEVKLTFPKDYGAKELAGRDAIFDVEITELREPAEAKLDNEFAKSLGLDDLSALEKAIEEQLGQEYENQSRLAVKKALLDHLDTAHDFEIPPTMLDLEYKNIMQQIELDRQRNPQEKKADLTDKEKEEYREIADRRVRLGLLLAEIGRQNNIKISDPELQKAVIMEAQRYPGQEREVFDYYAKNRNALESMRAPLFEDKVVNFILELMDIDEKNVTAEELIAAIEGDEPEKKKSEKKESATKKPTEKKSGSAKKSGKK